ncbi:MAG TPA: Hpt domain-containing protein [Hyphomicrobiales bacterium]|nr:Hpt domain-containing protein [Hyphomicrobiales bacterium]
MLHARTAAVRRDSEFPSPAGRPIDLVHLSRQTMGDRALERETLEIFRRQARRLMFRLEATTDRGGRTEIAHLLLGAARAVGAPRVAAAADLLESAALSGRGIDAAVAAVAEATAEATAELDRLLADM